MSAPGFLLWLALAFFVFRLAELVVFDFGPSDILFRLRAWTGLYDTDAQGAAPFQNANGFQHWLGGVLDCVHCAGVYWAFIGASVWLLWVSLRGEFAGGSLLEPALVFVVVWWSLAGMQSAIAKVAGRNAE